MRPRLPTLVSALIVALAAVPQGNTQTAGSAASRDFSGVWLLDGGTATFSAEPPPTMTAWGKARYAANVPTVGPNAALDANDPTLDCLPPGVPYVLTIPTPFELIHTADQLLQIFEYDHSLRRIFVDGRPRPADLQLTGMYQWMGYSTASWDGDALVIETSGFNDRSWLDRSGRPHSDELVVTERLERIDDVTLVNAITIDDPKTYTRPWHGRLVFKRKEGWALFEHICVSEGNGNDRYREYKERAWQQAE
jgi:hypothetical protein